MNEYNTGTFWFRPDKNRVYLILKMIPGNIVTEVPDKYKCLITNENGETHRNTFTYDELDKRKLLPITTHFIVDELLNNNEDLTVDFADAKFDKANWRMAQRDTIDNFIMEHQHELDLWTIGQLQIVDNIVDAMKVLMKQREVLGAEAIAEKMVEENKMNQTDFYMGTKTYDQIREENKRPSFDWIAVEVYKTVWSHGDWDNEDEMIEHVLKVANSIYDPASFGRYLDEKKSREKNVGAGGTEHLEGVSVPSLCVDCIHRDGGYCAFIGMYPSEAKMLQRGNPKKDRYKNPATLSGKRILMCAARQTKHFNETLVKD